MTQNNNEKRRARLAQSLTGATYCNALRWVRELAAEGIFPRSDDPEAMKSALIAKYPGIKFKGTP